MCESGAPAVQTYRELRASGLSRAAIAAQLAGLRLTRLRRGVYAWTTACEDACTAASHGGRMACITAARHRGLWTLDQGDGVHVWMRAHGHRSPHDGPDCGCIAHWDAGEPAGRDAFGIPSTPRILRQVLACRGVEEFFVALESALRQRMLTPDGLAWLRAHTNDEARTALELARSDADSGLESLLRWRLRRWGLPIRTQARIPSVGVVDVLIGDKLLIEADGVENHDAGPLRHKDLARDANAAAWGYVTLRFDYALIVHDWDLVERAILGQLAAGHHL
jgi:very-short-patch-repair endonuclease